MYLLVAIDTEGDDQWSAEARRNQRFENIYALARLHDRFVRHGVRPTYVITHPVAKDPRSAEVLRGLLAGGGCEIGAHHHAWETPPCTDDDIRRHPYASTLPRRQFEAQLEQLTAAIGEAACNSRSPIARAPAASPTASPSARNAVVACEMRRRAEEVSPACR